MSLNWSRFVSLIEGHGQFVLTSHIRPDADALGSELGLAGVLESLGKTVRIVNADPCPPNLQFLDPDGRLHVLGRDATVSQVREAEALIVLDTSAWGQLGAMGDVLRDFPGAKLVLDHHVSADDLGAEVFKNVQAEATGRLVIEAAEKLGVELTAEMARPLLAAVTTDTGWFRFASTTGDALRYAARLLDAGASPSELYAELYERDTLARLKLMGLVLARTVAEVGGRLVYTCVTQEDFRQTGAVPSDTEDVINLTLRVRGSEVAAMFTELPEPRIKVSLRSRAGFDCSRLTERFGGGGHRAAAGVTLSGTLAEVTAQILDAIRASMR